MHKSPLLAHKHAEFEILKRAIKYSHYTIIRYRWFTTKKEEHL